MALTKASTTRSAAVKIDVAEAALKGPTKRSKMKKTVEVK